MALNTGKLAGRTAYISGASRGIGKAIALKLAKDGANVVIAAKTATAHPKLPGTIFTAAKEIEEAGGTALPCIVDIRDEESVVNSVEQAVKTFGGIDILVNNASAISLTGTLDTPMKKYDLMNSVNARGTYMCSQACLPYLKKGKNPHILNISPPLLMKPVWFQNHTAYTMAKYGMSMCVLGMSAEFKEDGVAVNALWPRTAIATAAIEMLGGDEMMKRSRKPDIMADAAYVMLTRDSRSYTGHFEVDDDVLKSVGVSDLEEYSWIKGADLLPDYFLDSAEEHFTRRPISKRVKTASKKSGGSIPVDTVFNKIESLLSEEMVKKVDGVIRFDLTGDNPGEYMIDLKNGKGAVYREIPSDLTASCTFVMSGEDFVEMFQGKLNSMQAFMSGRMQIKGDLSKAMRIENIMKTVQSKL